MAKNKAAKEIREEPLEKQLWKAADKLRKNIDAAWRTGEGGYEDVKGFCASVPLARVAERFAALKAEFEAQVAEEAKLNAAIAESLAKVKP